MGAILCVIGFLALPIFIIISIVAALRRSKNTKIFAFCILGSFVLFITGAVINTSTTNLKSTAQNAQVINESAGENAEVQDTSDNATTQETPATETQAQPQTSTPEPVPQPQQVQAAASVPTPAPAPVQQQQQPQQTKVDKVVYWTPKGKSYHSTPNCPTLSRSKDIRSGSLSNCPKSDPCDRCVH